MLCDQIKTVPSFIHVDGEFLAQSTIAFQKADFSLSPIIKVKVPESKVKAILNDNCSIYFHFLNQIFIPIQLT